MLFDFQPGNRTFIRKLLFMSNPALSWSRDFWIILRGGLILTAIYFLGTWLSAFLPVPVPGAVIGMVIVFVLLKTRILPLQWVDSGAVWLLSFLGLFYVPYGVGIVQSGELISLWGGHIVLMALVTVLVVFLVSARFYQKFSRTSDFNNA